MDLENVAKVHKALSEPIRVRIIKHLMDNGECSICNIHRLIDRNESVVSRHMEILNDSGLVVSRKVGRSNLCKISNKDRVKSFLNV